MGVSALALALALSCSARASASPGESESSGAPVAQASDAARIAEAALKLERAFSAQFVEGQVDRDALAPFVADAVRSMPEAVQPQVDSHIARVIDAGQRLASAMTPDQRAQLVAARPPRHAQIAVVNPWGVPIGQDALGWGGFGAFGYPGAGYNCIPYNTGYAYPYGGVGWNGITTGYSSGYYSALNCAGGFGYGLGF
jgi:hypothetical protein